MTKKLLTHDGKTMSISAWARELGINKVTLQARLGRYGMPLEQALQGRSLSIVASGKHYKKHPNGDWEHRVLAEIALGKPLPPGAVVHHVDENRSNNNPGNLVVCPNQAYHRLLHMRMDAFKACGNYDWRKCCYCKVWDSQENLRHNKTNRFHHRDCHNEYHYNLRRKTK